MGLETLVSQQIARRYTIRATWRVLHVVRRSAGCRMICSPPRRSSLFSLLCRASVATGSGSCHADSERSNGKSSSKYSTAQGVWQDSRPPHGDGNDIPRDAGRRRITCSVGTQVPPVKIVTCQRTGGATACTDRNPRTKKESIKYYNSNFSSPS